MAETQTGEFERSIERLEAIVKELESGSAGLDESVRLYSEGRELAKKCQALLDRAQKTIDGPAIESPAVGQAAGAAAFSFEESDEVLPF
jgi:exodeoxyribonuclease VII small subunit